MPERKLPTYQEMLPMSHWQKLPKPFLMRKYVLLILLLLLPIALLLPGLFFSPVPADPTPAVINPTLQPSPTETIINTANWPTYTDTKTGFSIKYPDTWSEGRNANDDTTFNPLPDPDCLPPNACGGVPQQITIEILDKGKQTFDEFIEAYKVQYELSGATQGSDRNLYALIDAGLPPDTINALFAGGMCHTDYIFIEHGSQIIAFNFQCLDEEIIAPMLSSFKLL